MPYLLVIKGNRIQAEYHAKMHGVDFTFKEENLDWDSCIGSSIGPYDKIVKWFCSELGKPPYPVGTLTFYQDEVQGLLIMNETEKRLVEALRSDYYEQTTGTLRRGDKFCCLGVACDVSGIATWRQLMNTPIFIYGHGASGKLTAVEDGRVSLPRSVMKQLNWNHTDGILSFDSSISLSLLNDEGFTFSQIADIIEAGLVEHYDV